MKARNREINIFSLSMMDVISGAMGAFLIILIILSRYYESDPSNTKSVVEIAEEIERVEQRIKQIQKLYQTDTDPERIWRELQTSLQELAQAKRQLRDVQTRLDQASSQIKRLNKQVDNLKQENQELDSDNRKLASRRPYVIEAYWDCPKVNVDFYLQTDVKSTSGKSMPLFDPNRKQNSFFTGDLYINDPSGPGTDVWLVRNTVGGTKHKLYYKLLNVEKDQSPCQVRGGVFTTGDDTHFPNTMLSGKRPWQFIGTVEEKSDGKVTFAAATPEQQRAEEQAVRKRLGQ